MKFLMTVIVAGCLRMLAVTADADEFRAHTRIWVKVLAEPHESRWEACRRAFRQDVYAVRKGAGDIMWCWVESSRAIDHDEPRQNFNRR